MLIFAPCFSFSIIAAAAILSWFEMFAINQKSVDVVGVDYYNWLEN